MQNVINFVTNYWTYVPMIIGAAAAAAAVLPQGTEGTLWYSIRKTIDFLAANFGNAKNVAK